jgi:hypothetical protein
MANYTLETFISIPSDEDVLIKIYDYSKRLRYTIEPKIAYFLAKANIIIIKLEDKNDINLDFASSTEALEALSKLNDVKKILTDVIKKAEPKAGTSVFSKTNLNMEAKVTLNDGDLACNTSIIGNPILNSCVNVYVNGVGVNVGGKYAPFECYFSNNSGVTSKTIGSETMGDKLYWNSSVAKYNLDTLDIIDFEFLISNI